MKCSILLPVVLYESLLFSVKEYNQKGLSYFLVCTKSESTISQS